MNPQLRRLLLDLGPLFIFFGTFQFFGIFVATAAFIPAILVALAVGYYLERKLSPMAIVTALIVVVFGGLTLYFKNAVFLKMKPTVIYLMFASALIGGLWFDRLFIKYALSFEFELPEADLALPDLAVGDILSGARRSQRGRVAQLLGSQLGLLQGLDHSAADLPVRRRAGAPARQAHEARRHAGGLKSITPNA